jgi:hypothetical protein
MVTDQSVGPALAGGQDFGTVLAGSQDCDAMSWAHDGALAGSQGFESVRMECACAEGKHHRQERKDGLLLHGT